MEGRRRAAGLSLAHAVGLVCAWPARALVVSASVVPFLPTMGC